MFKKVFALIEVFAFWFIFLCVCCLCYSVTVAILFSSLPTGLLLVADVICLVWCYFAGTFPVLYAGLVRIKNMLPNFNE